MRTVAISGYFDPIHDGHIEYIKMAKAYGDKLIVIVNNREQAILKKGYEFMPLKSRMAIIESIKYVDGVVVSIDRDETVRETLRVLKPNVFAKGGDRNKSEIPERNVCINNDILIIDGLGEKIQSSSELVGKQKVDKFNKTL